MRPQTNNLESPSAVGEFDGAAYSCHFVAEAARGPSEPVAAADDLPALWLRWQDDPHDATTQEALLAAHMGLTEREVLRLAVRIPKHVDREDLRLAALEALYLALQNFDLKLGTCFEAYARKRIRGALIDMLRNQDGVPQNFRRATQCLAAATQNFRNRHARAPCGEELADELKVTSGELRRLEFQSQAAGRLSLDAQPRSESRESGLRGGSLMSNLGRQDNPLERMIDTETRDALVDALQVLPEREHAILVLHYYEGIRFNEIAAAMSVSEPRISQLHSMALQRLREHLARQRICQAY